jgi:uncharacterized membrane protein HdeD (DUF308 family)
MTDSPGQNVNVKLLGPNPWAALLIIGVLTLGLGVWLILSRQMALTTVAVLLAIGLFLNGLSELVFAPDRSKPVIGYVLGALLLAGGVVVLLQPGTGLRVLAPVIGVILVAVGVFQAASALYEREEVAHWAWLLVFGLVTVAVGIAAIVWPDVTIRVISILFGIRLIIVGGGAMSLGWALHSLRDTSDASSAPD